MEDQEIVIKNIALKLAQKRIEKGISAYALSTKLGKSKNYISQFESGNVNISIKTLLEICQILETNLKELC